MRPPAILAGIITGRLEIHGHNYIIENSASGSFQSPYIHTYSGKKLFQAGVLENMFKFFTIKKQAPAMSGINKEKNDGGKKDNGRPDINEQITMEWISQI